MEIDLYMNGKRVLTDNVGGRTFSSGSVGMYMNGKVTINGYVYQTQVTLTAVGTKPPAKVNPQAVLDSLD